MATAHILVGASTSPAQPVVRRISPSDLFQSLARGIDDFGIGRCIEAGADAGNRLAFGVDVAAHAGVRCYDVRVAN